MKLSRSVDYKQGNTRGCVPEGENMRLMGEQNKIHGKVSLNIYWVIISYLLKSNDLAVMKAH